MLNPWLVLVPVVSAVVAALAMPRWIRLCTELGWTAVDVHKAPGAPRVANMGGVPVLVAFFAGIVVYVAERTYELSAADENAALLAVLLTTGLAATIGLIDDATGWKRGLSQPSKAVLAALAGLPLWATGATGAVPWWAAMLVVTLSSNAFNIVAGYNGLEAGLGVITLLAVGALAAMSGAAWVSVVASAMAASLLVALWWNRLPARVFPGNVLTYATGALIGACLVVAGAHGAPVDAAAVDVCGAVGVAIGGQNGAAPLILGMLYLVQIALKARGAFRVESFAAPTASGALVLRQPGIYGVEHIAVAVLGPRDTEGRVVMLLWATQAAVCALAVAWRWCS